MMWRKHKLSIYFDKNAKELFDNMPKHFGPSLLCNPFDDDRDWMTGRENPFHAGVRITIREITLSQPFEETITTLDNNDVRVFLKYRWDERLGPRTSGRAIDGSDPWDQWWYAYDKSTILITIKDLQNIDYIFANYATDEVDSSQ